ARLTAGDLNQLWWTAMNAQTVSEIVQGERKHDLVVRLDEPYRDDPEQLKRLSINLPGGGKILLTDVAEMVEASGPNTINRENVRRRIVVQCNTAKRDLHSIV